MVLIARFDRTGRLRRFRGDASSPHAGGVVMARTKPAEALMPADGCDVLIGIDQISRWFGWSTGQTNARIKDRSVVTFKLPNRSTTYALKSENMRLWRRAAAEAYRDKSSGLT
jgi:hypothetical protein